MFNKALLFSLSLGMLTLSACSKEEAVDPVGQPTTAVSTTDVRICTEMHLDSGDEPINSLAGLPSKFWTPGEVIRIKFLNGDATLQNRVRNTVSQWTQYANVSFRYVGPNEPADVRIGFQWNGNTGSWSYIGKDCLVISASEPTMNFGWFNSATTDAEISRTALHEFGHALGLIHEHQSPAANIPWDKPKVYEYYARTNGWTTAQVDNDLFARYDASVSNYSAFDAQSIMLYAIPAELTTNGFSTPWNYYLSSTDKSFIGSIYPFPSTRSVLSPGQELLQNQSISSRNGQFRLVFQTDGNLVVYNNDNQPVWASGTGGRPYIVRCVMQTDGNLVLYDANSTPHWHTSTGGRPGTSLVMQDDGNLVLYQGSTAIWSSWGSSVLRPGQELLQNQSISSRYGGFKLIMQTDGNLVVYNNGNQPVWASGTGGRPYIVRCVMQTDGNLVLYDANSTPHWHTGTGGRPGASLVMQDDGNLVIYQGNTAIWSSGTHGV